MPLYLGQDIHSKWSTISGVDSETGNVVAFDHIGNDIDSLTEVFSKMNGPIYGAMEGGTNAWAMYRRLLPFFEKLIVVDPKIWTRELNRGAKTDKRDAFRLAVRLSRGELDGLYVPDERTQEYRNLLRAKINFMRDATKISNQITSFMRSLGYLMSSRVMSKGGRQFIEDIKPDLSDANRWVLEMYLDLLDKILANEAELDAKIKEIADNDEVCRQLMSIPQVGCFTAFAIRAEIGDISRFRDAEALISYCGLCPQVYSSGGKTHYGYLTKACNLVLRYVLILRASGMTRLPNSNPLKKAYLRGLYRSHANNGKLNMARKLVRIIFAMLSRNENWNPARFEPCAA